jgi:hypothetical protein
MMLTLKEFMELVDYKITEGSDYWPEGNFGGRQLYSLSAWNGDHDGWSFNIGFDPKDDQRVYVVEACDYKYNRAYRLIDSSLKTDKEAWDGVNYIDLEEDDDFMQKGLAIRDGVDYDTRVNIPLNVPDDVLFELMKRAHDQDITLNQLVEDVLWEAIRAEEDKSVLDSQYPDGDGYWRDEDGWDEIAEDHHDDSEEDLLPKMKGKKKKKK